MAARLRAMVRTTRAPRPTAASPGPIQGRIPRWFLDSLDATQEVEGALRNALLDLRHVLRTHGLGDGARRDLSRTLTGLEQTAGRIALLQGVARGALEEILGHDAGIPEALGETQRRRTLPFPHDP